jgi:hypothetical protein
VESEANMMQLSRDGVGVDGDTACNVLQVTSPSNFACENQD